ncbi:hypothetical protein Y032_0192g1375 [Ancylostoma ceylanicum]|uniref:Uncharacterized protein n=1 Tax=Ancylostoma ceylanicum TaxID=53326 RepID=A0A016SQN3_9BILA|nr:hypothetical protein Y032_0192g1375 [Ancylostoma ceylanicum]
MWKRVNARTSPGSDLQEARPPPVVKERGLPRDERPRLKTLVRSREELHNYLSTANGVCPTSHQRMTTTSSD